MRRKGRGGELFKRDGKNARRGCMKNQDCKGGGGGGVCDKMGIIQ